MNSRLALAWLALGVIAAAGHAGAQTLEPGQVVVSGEGGELTIRAREASLRDVLRAIASRTGLALTIHGPADPTVTVAIERATVDEAIERVVRDGYVLADDRLIVFLVPGKGERPSVARTEQPALQPDAKRSRARSSRGAVTAAPSPEMASPVADPPPSSATPSPPIGSPTHRDSARPSSTLSPYVMPVAPSPTMEPAAATTHAPPGAATPAMERPAPWESAKSSDSLSPRVTVPTEPSPAAEAARATRQNQPASTVITPAPSSSPAPAPVVRAERPGRAGAAVSVVVSDQDARALEAAVQSRLAEPSGVEEAATEAAVSEGIVRSGLR